MIAVWVFFRVEILYNCTWDFFFFLGYSCFAGQVNLAVWVFIGQFCIVET